MSFLTAFLAEFDHEAATTLRFLERVPSASLDWSPHEKSMTLGQLAQHIAEVPGFIADMATPDVYAWQTRPSFPQPDDAASIVATARASFAHARDVIAGFSEARLGEPWRAERDGVTILELPRTSLLRMILMNHWLHHRGQLSVYLRQVGAEVPSAYGPSADEVPEFMQPAGS